MLSSTDNVEVLIVTCVPSIVKSPFTLTLPSKVAIASVTVSSVFPLTVVVTAPSVTVMLSFPTVKAVFAATVSSTYFLFAKSPSADGAPVAPPVMVLALADITISPTSKPLLTLKLRVVMVPYLPHDYC